MNAKVLIVLENTDVENVSSVEELILAQNQLKIIDAGYQELGVDTPEWVLDKLSAVSHEITMRVRNELARQLRAAKARRDSLRTRDEKRQDLDARIAELENKLS